MSEVVSGLCIHLPQGAMFIAARGMPVYILDSFSAYLADKYPWMETHVVDNIDLEKLHDAKKACAKRGTGETIPR